MRSRILNWGSIFPLNDPPDYEPPPECSIASQASAKGVSPEELAYDFLLKNDGRAFSIVHYPTTHTVISTVSPICSKIQHNYRIGREELTLGY